MKIKESIGIEGRFRLQCFTKEGKLKWNTGWKKNLITSAGKAQIALLAGSAAAVPFTYLALGTSATAVGVGDTALNAEITDTGLARTAATVSRTTTTVTNDTLSLAYIWTASGAKTIEEIGVFTASSGGEMLSHALTGSKTTANTDQVIESYLIKFA